MDSNSLVKYFAGEVIAIKSHGDRPSAQCMTAELPCHHASLFFVLCFSRLLDAR